MAVGRDAGAAEKRAVGRSGLHDRDERNARPEFGRDFFDGPHQVGVERRRRTERVRVELGDRNLRIPRNPGKGLLDFFDGLSREYTAVHGGTRELRQRVGGVAAIQLRRHARRAKLRVVARLGGEARQSGRVRLRRRHGLHVGRQLAGLERGHALEVASRGLVQLDGKVELRQTVQRGSQMVDRVVVRGERTVAARAFHLELIVDVDLFTGLNPVHVRLAAF